MKSRDFRVLVNDSFEFDNLLQEDVDIVATGSRTFHVLRQNRSYNAELVETHFERKEISLRINGTLYQVKLSDPYDQMVQRLGLAAAKSQVAKEVKAPMPGLVLQLNVSPGEVVEKGMPLLVLEAMKMENIIRAPSDGKVKDIHVSQGQAVEKNQLLIELA